MIFRLILVLAATIALAGCDRGLSACEQATQSALAPDVSYQQVGAEEEPGVTPAMTYYVIDYIVTDRRGTRLRERVHCSYMRDTGEAVPHLILSEPHPS